MFELFEQLFLNPSEIIPIIIVFVIAFLVSFFKVKKLGTNLIVCAICVLVYVICSFLNYFNSLYLFSCTVSYILWVICMFVGGFAIAVFVGFAIDTVFRLIKQK